MRSLLCHRSCRGRRLLGRGGLLGRRRLLLVLLLLAQQLLLVPAQVERIPEKIDRNSMYSGHVQEPCSDLRSRQPPFCETHSLVPKTRLDVLLQRQPRVLVLRNATALCLIPR